MNTRTCAHCQKPLKPNKRGLYCNRRCTWRAWRRRAIARGHEALLLHLPTLPREAETILATAGPDRLRVANQLALVGRAPAGAYGYRVGIQNGESLMRWFPPARFQSPPMFLLEPFEWPLVPRAGTYAVVYLDASGQPLGGPRFTLSVQDTNPRLLLGDGDRTYKPRRRC
ncbi:MAG: hypothetical protein U1A78_25850 [Polyangia bacterium]